MYRSYLCIYMQTDTKTGKDLCTTLVLCICINISKDTYIDTGRDICGRACLNMCKVYTLERT